MQEELAKLQQRYPAQPTQVLKAYLKAKAKLEKKGLPAVAATGKKLNLKLASYAFNHGLLDGLSGKECGAYRVLLEGLPFQYRSLEVIAEEAGVCTCTVKSALRKLESAGLIARHRVPNSSCVIAFTDAVELTPVQVAQLKAEMESHLFEKMRSQPLNKRVQPTAAQLTVLSKKSPKKEKEYSASPSCVFFSGGLGANGETVSSEQAGYKHDVDDAFEGGEQDVLGSHGSSESPDTPDTPHSHVHDSPDSPDTPDTPHSHVHTDFHVHGSSESPDSHVHTDFYVPDSDLLEDDLYESPETPVQSRFDMPVSPVQSKKRPKPIKPPGFTLVPRQMQDQKSWCTDPLVLGLQSQIEWKLSTQIKPFDICDEYRRNAKLHHMGYKVRDDGYFTDDCSQAEDILTPYIKNRVMRGVLCQLAAVRGDLLSQIETWIEFAKRKAEDSGNIGGLLAKVMLKAQEVDTSLLYPEAALVFEQFLNIVGIGSDKDLPEDYRVPRTEAENHPDSQKAASNARKSLLQNYSAVVQALFEREQRSNPDYPLEEIPHLLKTFYDNGDANGSMVRENAPGAVKVSMVKYMLHTMVDRDFNQMGMEVYLPHWIHKAKKEAQAAAMAARAAAA